MKLSLMPHEPSWWVWTVTAVLLAFGISGHPEFFLVAIALSVMQTFFFLNRERAFAACSVQIRIAYAALLLVPFLPVLRWLYWAPMVGTLARVLFGYCLLSRLLSLMPWNRHKPITFDLLRCTLLTPPVVGSVHQGLPGDGCPGGICSLEVRTAGYTSQRSSPNWMLRLAGCGVGNASWLFRPLNERLWRRNMLFTLPCAHRRTGRIRLCLDSRGRRARRWSGQAGRCGRETRVAKLRQSHLQLLGRGAARGASRRFHRRSPPALARRTGEQQNLYLRRSYRSSAPALRKDDR